METDEMHHQNHLNGELDAHMEDQKENEIQLDKDNQQVIKKNKEMFNKVNKTNDMDLLNNLTNGINEMGESVASLEDVEDKMQTSEISVTIESVMHDESKDDSKATNTTLTNEEVLNKSSDEQSNEMDSADVKTSPTVDSKTSSASKIKRESSKPKISDEAIINCLISGRPVRNRKSILPDLTLKKKKNTVEANSIDAASSETNIEKNSSTKSDLSSSLINKENVSKAFVEAKSTLAAKIIPRRKSTSSIGSAMSYTSNASNKSLTKKLNIKAKTNSSSQNLKALLAANKKRNEIRQQAQQPKAKKFKSSNTVVTKKKKDDKENESNQDNIESDEENDEMEDNKDEEKENTKKEDILNGIELEYLKLVSNSQPIRKENVCAICEFTGDLIECQGTCQNSFHVNCLGLLNQAGSNATFKCKECTTGVHACFVCKDKDSSNNSNDGSSLVKSQNTKKCIANGCGKYFHDECVTSNPLFRKDQPFNPDNPKYICPMHACLTCWIETRHNSENSAENHNSNLTHQSALAFKGRFYKCIRCPTAYHVGEHCLAAGAILLGGCHIICPSHFKKSKNCPTHQRVNVTWCYVCVKSNDLIYCTRCPAAYHHSCLHNPPPLPINNEVKEEAQVDDNKTNQESLSPASTRTISDRLQTSPTSSCSSYITSNSVTKKQELSASHDILKNWICDDCRIGKMPLYGQIVWVKVGQYRWWPAQICLPRLLPERVLKIHHEVGEFPVQFFGSLDYYWVNIGRTFVFAPGDESGRSKLKNPKKLEVAYENGFKQAEAAFKEVERLKLARYNSITGKDGLKFSKQNYHFIKTSKPYGNVVIYRVPIDDLPRCECDPKDTNPCSTDSCVNRALKYECHPASCPAGKRCQNQRFVQRKYPKQEPINTGERGWGLKTLVDIKKGEFVNEYVGEIIDKKERERRLELAHQNDVHNFYFLDIDSNRTIDAGPKGNLARFINHSCGPNLETQKWNVNGDIRIGLFAVCDIAANNELTFNYNLDCLSNEKAICKCGSKNCGGFLGARPKNGNDNAKNSDASSSANKGETTSTNGKKIRGRKKSTKTLNESKTSLVNVVKSKQLKSSANHSTLVGKDVKNGKIKARSSSAPRLALDTLSNKTKSKAKN